MYEENIKKYIERFKKEYNESPTEHQINEASKMFIQGPTGPRDRLAELYSQLGYLLNLKPTSNSSYDILSILEDMKAVCKMDIDLRNEWWEVNK